MGTIMTVKELKKLLADKPDEIEIFFKPSGFALGNIHEFNSAYMSTYSTFGIILPCLLLEDVGEKELSAIDDHPNKPSSCY